MKHGVAILDNPSKYVRPRQSPCLRLHLIKLCVNIFWAKCACACVIYVNWGIISPINLNVITVYCPDSRTDHLNKGLFTWREEDPSTRKILEGGSS